jgi:hypothetical protein
MVNASSSSSSPFGSHDVDDDDESVLLPVLYSACEMVNTATAVLFSFHTPDTSLFFLANHIREPTGASLSNQLLKNQTKNYSWPKNPTQTETLFSVHVQP